LETSAVKTTCLVLFFSLSCMFGASAAPPAGPPAGFAIETDYTVKSPDGAAAVEQYKKAAPDESYNWQFWVRRTDSFSFLAPEQENYPADFRFTNDGRWLVRMQKTGSGELTSYLYRLGPNGFVSATRKPIGDLAWAFFYSRPESRKVMKPDFHMGAGLLKGLPENYRNLEVDWPENRYIVISLWGEVEPTKKHHQLSTVRGWRMRYDLQEGKFDVPQEFLKNNIDALKAPGTP
jgi:hypothetical protein